MRSDRHRRGRCREHLPGRDPAPEGIEAGPQHTLYVGSLAAGAVRQIDARTGASFTLVQPTPGRAATGLEYDPKGERLFVSGGGTGAAYVYDARTGAPIAD